MTMTSPHPPRPLLERRQALAVRDSLRDDLGSHPEWPDLWNLHGLLEAFEGNLEKARTSFAEGLRRNPSYRAARSNLAWVELLTGGSPVGTDEMDHGTVLGAVRTLLHGLPPRAGWAERDASAAFFAAALAARSGPAALFDDAIARLRALLPGMDELLERSELSAPQGVEARALEDLGRPERMNPGFADLLRRAGRLESIGGRDPEALRLHALAALFEGGQAAFLVEEAEIAARAGRSDEALDSLRKAVRGRPDWAHARAALGYELSRRGRADEALANLAEALRLEPRWADVRYQYGLLLHAGRRDEDAVRAMESALAINPSYVVARIALANLLFESDRAADAVPHYERVLEEGMDTPFLAGRFGYALHAAGDRNRAEELFLEAIAKDRNRPELLALYGQFLAETDRRLEARTVWDRALATSPPDRVRAEIETMRAEVSVEDRRHGK
jgi:tetratricopeptide (TPR) repeat protein